VNVEAPEEVKVEKKEKTPKVGIDLLAFRCCVR
jgi:hypothetical protein